MNTETRNTRSSATDATKANRRQARSNAIATTKETPTIVLKTLHDDILKANPNSTVTTKKMRVWLRANLREVHAHNDAWIFTQTHYDQVRAKFDPAYAAKLARDAKPKKVRKAKVAPVASQVEGDKVDA